MKKHTFLKLVILSILFILINSCTLTISVVGNKKSDKIYQKNEIFSKTNYCDRFYGINKEIKL